MPCLSRDASTILSLQTTQQDRTDRGGLRPRQAHADPQQLEWWRTRDSLSLFLSLSPVFRPLSLKKHHRSSAASWRPEDVPTRRELSSHACTHQRLGTPVPLSTVCTPLLQTYARYMSSHKLDVGPLCRKRPIVTGVISLW